MIWFTIYGISGFAELNFLARKRYGFWWPAFAALALVQVAAQSFRSMSVALLKFALDDWWVVSVERSSQVHSQCWGQENSGRRRRR